MATQNLGLDDSLTQLTEGQEQKEAAINSNTLKLIANLDVLDTSVPVFLGNLPSAPASGTAALGSTYYNTGDNFFYTLRGKSPDVWTQSSGGAGGSGAAWGDITGTLSAQTDLQAALDGKASASHTHALDDLSDVNVPSPTDGQVLTWNNTTSEWQAVTPSGGGGGLTELADDTSPTLGGNLNTAGYSINNPGGELIINATTGVRVNETNFLYRGTTTTTDDEELLIDFNLGGDRVATFELTVGARDTGNGDSLAEVVRFCFKTYSGTTTLLGSPVSSRFADAGASSWVVGHEISGNIVYITVKGASGRTINWTARIRQTM